MFECHVTGPLDVDVDWLSNGKLVQPALLKCKMHFDGKRWVKVSCWLMSIQFPLVFNNLQKGGFIIGLFSKAALFLVQVSSAAEFST